MPPTRRTVLGGVGAGALAALAGCSAFGDGGESRPVTVEIGGQFENERFVELDVVVDSASAGLSEHVLFRQSFTVGPDGLADSDGVFEDAFDARRALVRVHVGGVGVVDEYTFVPDCEAGDDIDDTLYVSLQSPLDATFRQNRCR